MAKIWITGIAGFLGSHLADALIADGHIVCGNDSLVCGDMDNVPQKALFMEVDCCDQRKMADLMSLSKPDVVYHCAATAHEGFSVFSPSFITKNIYEASVATFSAAIAAGVKRIVFMSSMARYGKDNDLPFGEGQKPSPVDPYGIAKVAAEDTLRALCDVHGVEYVIAVPHNIIGPRQRYVDPYRNVASIFMNRIKQGGPVYTYGDGTNQRCFSPVKDCLDALVKMMDAPVSGEIINIGPDNGHITINELYRKCVDACGIEHDNLVHIEERPLEVKQAYCSSDKARKLLGYKEQQTLEECLKEMADAITPKPFQYDFPVEIESSKMPRTWRERL